MPAKLLVALFVTVFLACFFGVAGGMIAASRYELTRVERAVEKQATETFAPPFHVIPPLPKP